jgi:hypothetical protein
MPQIATLQVKLTSQVFSTKYSLTLPAAALSYIEQVLVEVSPAQMRSGPRQTQI